MHTTFAECRSTLEMDFHVLQSWFLHKTILHVCVRLILYPILTNTTNVYFLILQLSTKNNDMMTSALTTVTPQNSTTKDFSILPTTTVQNALSTSFGASADKDVQDNKLSTNTAEITTTTSLSLPLKHNMQLMEAETSTHVVQNSTSLDSLAGNFSVEWEEKAPDSIQFFTMSDNKPPSELFVGMETTIAVVAEFPVGEYGVVTMTIVDESTELFFDVLSMSCKHGLSITSEKEYSINAESTRGSGFLHFSMRGIKREMMNVHISNTNEVENRQESCNFTIFLQHTNGLSDGQEVSIVARLELEKSLSDSNTTIERRVTFYARTTILENNKTASCEQQPLVPEIITVDKNFATSVEFRCWIPFYNPRIMVIISDVSDRPYTFVDSVFLKLSRFGSNFFPGPQADLRLEECTHMGLVNDALKLTFPSNWVNRAYYYTEETTDGDRLDFSSLFTLTESATVGVNYTFSIQVFLDEISFWNTTVLLTPKETFANETSRYHIDVYKTSEDELTPFGEISVYLKVTTPELYSNLIRLKSSTKALTENKDPAVVIKRVVSDTSSYDMLCNGILVDYQNGTSGIQNVAIITLTFLNTANNRPGSTSYRIRLAMDLAFASVGDMHWLIVETDQKLFKERVLLNKPLIFEDENGNISSKIGKVLDRKNESCFGIPVQGDNPPLLLMKLYTGWLKIDPAAFNITVVGEFISCRRHGMKLVQVAYPNGMRTSSLETGFNDKMNFCDMLSEISILNRIECNFTCRCQSITECNEVLIFMANVENLATWKLCELIASNVV